jgi:hypothetical protein
VQKQDATAVGLRYVSSDGLGLARRPRGRGFVYVQPSGARVTDPATLERVRALVASRKADLPLVRRQDASRELQVFVEAPEDLVAEATWVRNGCLRISWSSTRDTAQPPRTSSRHRYALQVS